MDALDAAVAADKAAIENAGEAIRADLAAIETSKIQLGYCAIRSPIDGRTGSILVQRGNLVKANDNPALVVIYQIQPVRVTFSIPEQRLSEVRRSMASRRVPVKVVIPGEESKPVEGTLTFVDNMVNSATGAIVLKGTFTNGDKRLWPGQFVNLVLTLSTQANAVVIPSEAIQAGQQGTYVFVIRSGKAESQPVTAGRSIGGLTVIDQGIQSGETVVTDGQLRLVPGARVQVKQEVIEKQERSS
jgi:multidrug efflux system membrane fusion protein